MSVRNLSEYRELREGLRRVVEDAKAININGAPFVMVETSVCQKMIGMADELIATAPHFEYANVRIKFAEPDEAQFNGA